MKLRLIVLLSIGFISYNLQAAAAKKKPARVPAPFVHKDIRSNLEKLQDFLSGKK